MKVAIGNTVLLLTLLIAAGMHPALADNATAASTNVHVDQIGDSHLMSPQSNRFSSLAFGRGGSGLMLLTDANALQAHVATPTGGRYEGAAVMRTGLSTVGLPFRPSGLEETARQYRREGLPIARLWQSESSALSVGFSPKGKPGIWFVKKLP